MVPSPVPAVTLCGFLHLQGEVWPWGSSKPSGPRRKNEAPDPDSLGKPAESVSSMLPEKRDKHLLWEELIEGD